MLLAAICFAVPQIAQADEPIQPRVALEGLIDSATITTSSSSTEDLFEKNEPTLISDGVMFNVDFSYDSASDLKINEGDTLKAKLVAKDSNKDFLLMNYQMSQNRILQDSETGQKIADVDMSDRKGFVLTFVDIDASFEANINMPFELRSSSLSAYFDQHPSETEVTFSYDLYINDQSVGKTVTLTAKKPSQQQVEQH